MSTKSQKSKKQTEPKTAKNNRLNQFPRTSALPSQSSKFWAIQKDRYLRQLLICDIEATTNRPLVVYFSTLSQGITHSDADDISEVLERVESDDVDIMIQTPGGDVDAVERFITMLQHRLKSYRVIVPGLAKSGGTAIAMSSEKILLGLNSELGPIDPQMQTAEGMIPCQYMADDETVPPRIQMIAKHAIERMKGMATKILQDGMMKGKTPEEVQRTIEALSSSDTYKSHGAVIDFKEALSLGLSVEWLEQESDLWKRLWLLQCCCEIDCYRSNIAKLFEGSRNSLARQAI